MNVESKAAASKLVEYATNVLAQMVETAKLLKDSKLKLGKLACEFEDKRLYEYIGTAPNGHFRSFAEWMVYVGEKMLGVSHSYLRDLMLWERAAKAGGISEDIKHKVPVSAIKHLIALPPQKMKEKAKQIATGVITVKELAGYDRDPSTLVNFTYHVAKEKDRQMIRDTFELVKVMWFSDHEVLPTHHEMFVEMVRFVNEELNSRKKDWEK